jgi:hypothetical protein
VTAGRASVAPSRLQAHGLMDHPVRSTGAGCTQWRCGRCHHRSVRSCRGKGQTGGARSTLRRKMSSPRIPRAISLSSTASNAAPDSTWDGPTATRRAATGAMAGTIAPSPQETRRRSRRNRSRRRAHHQAGQDARGVRLRHEHPNTNRFAPLQRYSFVCSIDFVMVVLVRHSNTLAPCKT